VVRSARVENEVTLQARYEVLFQHLDERQRRLVAAADAEQLGHGGVSIVARTSGLSRPTIHKGLRELRDGPLAAGRTRRAGGGRKGVEEASPAVLERLEELIDPVTRGDPMSPLRWTAKSTRHLAQALSRRGPAVSHETVAQLLKVLGYSLQGTMKTLEGQQHPDRNAQFEYVHQRVDEAISRAGLARDLGRYQEEGTHRKVPSDGARMAATGGTGSSPRA
jgi:transposase